MILGVTGHRPEKLGGYENNTVHGMIRLWFQSVIRDLQPKSAISGMALGADQLFAEACILEGIPFVAAIPGIWQADRWPKESRIHYVSLLDAASDVVEAAPPDTPFWTAMQLRNEWVVDHSDAMCAVWDGSSGGTKNCLEYAVNKGDKIKAVLDPRSLM